MQNNLADSHQHLESGLSMAAIKTSPPVIVSRYDVNGNTTTGLVNYNHSAIYGNTNNYCIAKT